MVWARRTDLRFVVRAAAHPASPRRSAGRRELIASVSGEGGQEQVLSGRLLQRASGELNPRLMFRRSR